MILFLFPFLSATFMISPHVKQNVTLYTSALVGAQREMGASQEGGFSNICKDGADGDTLLAKTNISNPAESHKWLKPISDFQGKLIERGLREEGKNGIKLARDWARDFGIGAPDNFAEKLKKSRKEEKPLSAHLTLPLALLEEDGEASEELLEVTGTGRPGK